MICTNNQCPIADNCWTFCKPPDETAKRVSVQPEQDDEIAFKCKEFEDFPE